MMNSGDEFFMLYELRHQAKLHGWIELYHKKEIGCVGFYHFGLAVRMDFYPRGQRAITSLWHPRKGPSVMMRYPVQTHQFETIMQNPRAHLETAFFRYL